MKSQKGNDKIYKYLIVFKDNNIKKEKITIRLNNPKSEIMFQEKIDRYKKKGIKFFTLSQATEEEIAKFNKSPTKITKKDIDTLLNLIMSLLSGGEQASELGKLARTMEKEIKLNYIIIYLLKSGNNIIEILKKIDFDNKEEIIEVLSNTQLTPEVIREKLENILVFNRKIKEAQGALKGQFASIAGYYIVIIAIVFGVKYGIFNLMKEKLGKYGLDVESALALPNQFMGIFINIVIGISVFIFFLIVLRIISKT